jgi:hypothetical protein
MAGISTWPDVVDTLLTLCAAALPDRAVIDGPGPGGDDAEHFLFIGMGDPRRDDSDAGKFDQEWNMSTTAGRRETGTVDCIALSYDGSGDQRAARQGAFETVGEVQRILRGDTRLGGVDGLIKTSFTGGLPDQVQTSRGAACAIRFSVDFEAQLKE